MELDKKDIGFDLEVLELAGRLAIKEHQELQEHRGERDAPSDSDDVSEHDSDSDSDEVSVTSCDSDTYSLSSGGMSDSGEQSSAARGANSDHRGSKTANSAKKGPNTEPCITPPENRLKASTGVKEGLISELRGSSDKSEPPASGDTGGAGCLLWGCSRMGGLNTELQGSNDSLNEQLDNLQDKPNPVEKCSEDLSEQLTGLSLEKGSCISADCEQETLLNDKLDKLKVTENK